MKDFEKDMASFSFKQHQDVLTYLARLETMGWTIEDAKLWVEEKRKELFQPTERDKVLSQKCPLCSAPMRLLPINITPATLTGENSKSVWLCPRGTCMNTIYNKESVAEIQTAERGGT
jgi:hypothetical protein